MYHTEFRGHIWTASGGGAKQKCYLLYHAGLRRESIISILTFFPHDYIFMDLCKAFLKHPVKAKYKQYWSAHWVTWHQLIRWHGTSSLDDMASAHWVTWHQLIGSHGRPHPTEQRLKSWPRTCRRGYISQYAWGVWESPRQLASASVDRQVWPPTKTFSLWCCYFFFMEVQQKKLLTSCLGGFGNYIYFYTRRANSSLTSAFD